MRRCQKIPSFLKTALSIGLTAGVLLLAGGAGIFVQEQNPSIATRENASLQVVRDTVYFVGLEGDVYRFRDEKVKKITIPLQDPESEKVLQLFSYEGYGYVFTKFHGESYGCFALYRIDRFGNARETMVWKDGDGRTDLKDDFLSQMQNGYLYNREQFFDEDDHLTDWIVQIPLFSPQRKSKVWMLGNGIWDDSFLYNGRVYTSEQKIERKTFGRDYYFTALTLYYDEETVYYRKSLEGSNGMMPVKDGVVLLGDGLFFDWSGRGERFYLPFSAIKRFGAGKERDTKEDFSCPVDALKYALSDGERILLFTQNENQQQKERYRYQLYIFDGREFTLLRENVTLASYRYNGRLRIWFCGDYLLFESKREIEGAHMLCEKENAEDGYLYLYHLKTGTYYAVGSGYTVAN